MHQTVGIIPKTASQQHATKRSKKTAPDIKLEAVYCKLQSRGADASFPESGFDFLTIFALFKSPSLTENTLPSVE